jgi:hypothetical protein
VEGRRWPTTAGIFDEGSNRHRENAAPFSLMKGRARRLLFRSIAPVMTLCSVPVNPSIKAVESVGLRPHDSDGINYQGIALMTHVLEEAQGRLG